MVKCVSPGDGKVFAERDVATAAEISTAIDKAKAAQKSWRKLSIAEAS